MQGLMSDRPLLISSLLEYGARIHGAAEVVSRTVEGAMHRYDWAGVHRRSMRLANALSGLGVREHDRVGTIAWNGYRHLELYYGVSGMGAVLHTINPRLHASQLAYIVNDAQDRVLFVDLTFVPLVEAVWTSLETVKVVVVMTDREHMPESELELLCYEELLEGAPEGFDWPELDERTASAICYTSGTTGNPKGVVYSHRSTVLHAYGASVPGSITPRREDAVLPVVPMFHVNAWGLPYQAAIIGYKLVLPGPRLDGEGLAELINAERATFYVGVPTIHKLLLDHLEESGGSTPSLRVAASGGAALTRVLAERFWDRGVEVIQGWGMTETSPLGTLSCLRPEHADLSRDEMAAVILAQGRPVFGVEVRIVGEDGRRLPEDDEAVGELQIRGPWIASAYLGEEPGARLDADGWFATGDVARISPDGTVQLTDRLKDVIKSGGEWISSIDLEDVVTRHPEISAAAVIGVPHEKWSERPLLIAVPAAGSTPSKESVLEFLEGQVAKWWIPDDVVFVEELPLGATGKVQKAKLRERYGS